MSRQVWALILAALLGMVGCSVAQQGADAEPPPGSITHDGVTYRAEVRFEETLPEVDVAPIMLRPWVTMTNSSGEPVEIRLAGCPVRLRVFEDPSRTGAPLWDQEREGSEFFRCMQDPYAVAVAPGSSREEAGGFDAKRILNAGVAPGRYYFSVILALQGQRLELAAGEGELTYGIEGLVFSAESEVVDIAPRNLETPVTVTNTTDKRVRIEFGACSVMLQAYRDSRRSGTPAWDERQRPNPDPETGIYWGCPGYLAVRDLRPGESLSPKEFQRSIPEPDILGKRLADARYYLAATIEVNGTSVRIPAGEAHLVHAQDPLPAVRTRAGLRWEARTEALADAANLVTKVTVTNTSTAPLTIRLPQNCPVAVYAFLDRARRDAAFRSGEAELRNDGCVLDMVEITLNAGESRDLEKDITRGWAGPFRPQRYYLVATVFAGERSIVLSAGEVDLDPTVNR